MTERAGSVLGRAGQSGRGMARHGAARLYVVLAAALLAGCAYLPSSGPTAHDLVASADRQNDIGFKIVELTPAVARVLEAAPAETMSSLRLPNVPPPAVDRLGPGDVLAITIFAAGPGLFPDHGGQENANAGAQPSVNQTTLPQIVVDAQGQIAVPYVGTLTAAGLTPAELQMQIEGRLKAKAIEPQAMVTVAQNVANTIVISGDVKSPGRYPLTLAHETLLDLIAEAVGPLHAPQDVVVQLTRGDQQRRMLLSQIQTLSSENIALAPGDRIALVYQPRSYTAFGATGKVMEVPFESGEVSLADAIARAGGPFDQLADPSGIYLFRFERPDVAAALGLPAGQSDPVIYHIDLRQAESYFTIQKFAMRNQDVVFVATARSDSLQKFFNLINALFSPAIVTKTLAQ